MKGFGVIIYLLVFILIAVNSGKKKKRPNPPAKGAQAQPGASAPEQTDLPAMGPIRDLDEALEQLQQQLEADQAARARMARPIPVAPATPREGGAMLDDDACRGGSMTHAHTEGYGALEDEDCAGGSIAHRHTEGVSRAAHARRMAAIDANSAAERQSEIRAWTGAIDARALRRAVVMAEVLGKPRALRGR